MAVPRVLALIGGRIKQIITIATSAGVADAEKVVSTGTNGYIHKSLINGASTSAGAGDVDRPVLLDGSGRISTTMMPVGIGADTASVVSSENLTASDAVNIWNDAGTPKVRKADATTEGKEANGFVLAGVTAPASALVYFEGSITGLSGLTPGARYYLSTTPGQLTTTPPSASGNVVQFVGVATSATTLTFEYAEPVTIA